MVEMKEAVDSAKVALLRVSGIVGKPDRNQKLPIDIRIGPGQVVFGILHRFVDHLVGSGDCRVVLFQGEGARRPTLPIKFMAPWQAEKMAHENSQSIDLLAKLPVADIGVSSYVLKPTLHRFCRVRTQSNIRMVCNESFYMAPIPGNGLSRNVKLRERF